MQAKYKFGLINVLLWIVTIGAYFFTWDLGPFDDDDLEWALATIGFTHGSPLGNVRLVASFGTFASPLVVWLNSFGYSISQQVPGLLVGNLIAKLVVVTYLLMVGRSMDRLVPAVIAILLYLFSPGLLAVNPVRTTPEPFIPMAVAAVLYHYLSYRLSLQRRHLLLASLWAGIGVHFSYVCIPIPLALAVALLFVAGITVRDYLLAIWLSFFTISPLLFYVMDWKHYLGCGGLAALCSVAAYITKIEPAKRATWGPRLLSVLATILFLTVFIAHPGFFLRFGRLFYTATSYGAAQWVGLATFVGAVLLSVRYAIQSGRHADLLVFILVPAVAMAVFWIRSHWTPVHWFLCLSPTCFLVYALAIDRWRPFSIGALSISIILFLGIVIQSNRTDDRPFEFIPLKTKMRLAEQFRNSEEAYVASGAEPFLVPPEFRGWGFFFSRKGNSLDAPIYLCDKFRYQCPPHGQLVASGVEVSRNGGDDIQWVKIR